ncbi:MAG: SOS response-associated peptidase [Halobacterium sp.]
MCGRTSLFAPQPAVEARFDAEAAAPLRPRYNVAPGEDLAAVTNEAPATIDHLEWGLLPHWADDPTTSHRPINARAESVAEKPSFRDAYRERRALVLVDGYYEWLERPDDTTQPYRIERRDGEPFALAGLWERWSGEHTRDTVTVVTTAANDRLRSIHDRMPVVLSPDREREWLDAGAGEDLLTPYPEDDLRAYPVSTRVNDPANDDPSVVEPVDPEPTAQSGLDEFA